MSLNKVNVLPKCETRGIRGEARATVVTGAIDATLRFCLLDRMVPYPNGDYFFRNIKLGASVVTIILLFSTIYDVINRWDTFENPLLLFMDILSGLIWVVQCIVSYAFASLQKEEDLLAYYETLQDIDDRLLQFKKEMYRKDALRCNAIFFGTLSVQAITLMAEMILYRNSWSSNLAWIMSGTYYLARVAVSMTMLDYLTKLHVYRTRLVVFRKRLSEVESPSWVRVLKRRDRSDEEWQDERPVTLTCCYRLLSSLCHIINERFGFEIVMLYTNVTVTTILATYTIIACSSNSSRSDVFFQDPSLVIIFMLDVVEVNVVGLWLVQCVMSIDRRFREILLSLEHIVAGDMKGDSSLFRERSRDKWMELLAVCHRTPVQFTACGFFSLNYSLLAGLLGAMLTYTIMLVQSNKFSHY